MAYSAKQFSFVLFAVLLVSPHIEARQGKVFTNVIDVQNDNVKGSIFESPSPSPSPIISQISQAPESQAPFSSGIAPTPIDPVEGGPSPVPVEPVGGGGIAPAPVEPTPVEGGIAPAPSEFVEYDHAYGLYGRDGLNNQMLSKQTTYPTRRPTNNVDDLIDEDELPKDFEAESFRESNAGESYNTYGNSYNNDNNNNNGNGYMASNYYNKNGYTNNYNNNGNGYVERQGMSDTRFMENGRYYYDMNNENYNQNGYRNGNNGGRYYGDMSNYEFDSMDEYERQQGYSNTQREFVP